MSDEPDNRTELVPITELEVFEPMTFCNSLEKVMDDMPDEASFAIALDRGTIIKLIAIVRRGAAH